MIDLMDHPADPRKLDVFAITREAYQGGWTHFGEMVRLIWLPGLLYIAVALVSGALDSEANPGLRLLCDLAVFFLWPIIAVAWHRFILVGDATPGRFHLHFGRREARFLVVSIFLSLLALPGILIASMTAALNDPSLGTSASLLGFLGLIVLMVGLYYFVRLLLLLPAVAVDEPINARLILERTRGNFWRLLSLVILASLPLVLVIFAGASLVLALGLPGVILLVLGALVGVFFMIVNVAVISIAYRELIGPPGTLAFDLEGPDAPLN
ncbi:MAG TPA: hypothetical protein PKA57_13200 [Parvibaculum sp.]|uniref:hypothetical protein n=1 Tax=Parvibaculum sp. TaxID=2024848 RepID=UPI002D16A966|nr:hypothetical protein [Parvibaculum sp.]HMM15578.1 hypothetical protein [Parvibaculum sp.]